MADTTTERVPQTDAEFARDVDRRLDNAEQPTTLRAGEWTLSTDGQGNLIGAHSNGGIVTIAKKPPEGSDPDSEYVEPPVVIEEHKTPRLKIKGGIKSIANNSMTVYNAWNNGAGSADIEEPAGTWTWDGTNITIPEAGDYLVVVFMPWASNINWSRYLELRKNGTVVEVDKHMTGATADKNNVVNQTAGAQWEAYCKVTNLFRCAQGDTFQVAVWQDSGATVNCGGPNAGGQDWAQMMVLRVADSDVPKHDAGEL